MRIVYFVVLLMITLSSCDIKGVETNSDDAEEVNYLENDTLSKVKETDTLKVSKVKVPEVASDTLKLENGITITYFKKGEGEKLKKGDMIKIDYRAKLENGKIYDGNHMVKKDRKSTRLNSSHVRIS